MNTYKISLRKFTLKDANSLAEYANNREIWLNLRDIFPYPYTIADAKHFIESKINKTNPLLNFAIDYKGFAIGSIGVIPQTDVFSISAEIGYWIGQPFWGNGFATEAVNLMTGYLFSNFSEIEKIYALVFSTNKASMRVLEKAGFEKEAALKRALKKDGNILDLSYYSIFK